MPEHRAPVTTLTYDKLGRQLTVRDANGHVNATVYDAAGQLAEERHADGAVVRHAYDAFGDRVASIDANRRATRFLSDKLGRLVTTYRASHDAYTWGATGLVLAYNGESLQAQTQTWDAAGRLLSRTNTAGETTRYAYDLRGNLIRTTQPLGQSTRAAYDANNRKVIEMDANGALSTWKYDAFGLLRGHTDIGLAKYAYTYDRARQLVAQSNTRGQNLRYQYDAAGQVLRIDDAGTGTVSAYRYDLAGRRVRETTSRGSEVYQDNRIAYDALGRMRWTADARSTLTIDYDKVGNRTHVGVYLDDLASERNDRYYQYDAMNRQTVVDAADAAGNLGERGHRLTYDLNGNRTSDTSIGTRITLQDGRYVADVGPTTEAYSYDPLNRLTGTVRDGVQVDTRLYDGADRVLASGPITPLPAGYAEAHKANEAALGGPLLGRLNRYDANGRMLVQQNFADGKAVNGTTYDRYDNAGNVLRYVSDDVGSITRNVTTNSVQRAEGYRTAIALTEGAVIAGPNAGRVPPTRAGLTYAYDANGHLARTTDVLQQTFPTYRSHSFVNDVNGQALYAYYGDERNPGAPPANAQRQLIVNGEVLGRYGDESTQRFGNLLGPQFEAKSEFGIGYQPIDGNYPAGSPGTYAVAAGDTLKGIAKGAYGDEGLWYVIADANGLSSSADLRSGQVLTIPNRVASANNEGTFKPYDPTAIQGDLSPTAMAVPGDGAGGCGGVGQIVVLAIAVVVAFYVGPLATSFFDGAFGAGAAATFAGGATAAAAGSVASQAAGVAIGTQDQFSWKQVALSAVSGGIGAGLGGIPTTGNAIADAAIRQAAGNVLTQGVAVATGLQSSFNWRSVAASAVGGATGAAVGPVIGEAFSQALGSNEISTFGARLATGLVAGAATAVTRGGRVSVQQVATDAFGNVLGDSLAAANGQQTDPLGAFISKNQQAWDARSAAYGQVGDVATDPTNVSLQDGSTTSAAENLRRANTFSRSAYALNDVNDAVEYSVFDAGPDGGPSSARRDEGPARDLIQLPRLIGPDGLPTGEEVTVEARYERDLQGSDDSPNEAVRFTNYPSPFIRWSAMSNQPAEAHTLPQWQEAARGYKAYQGPAFTRDSTYNGLWTKAAQLDIAAGNYNRGIGDQVAGVAIEANLPAHTGIGVGAAAGTAIGRYASSNLGLQNAASQARPSYLTSEQFAELPRAGQIDPRLVRYSQDNAAAQFKPPYGSVDDFINKLRAGEINHGSVDPIRLVERDGKIFTLDNRRLYSYEQAGIDIWYQKLDAIPKREAFKFSTVNDGTSITIRKGNGQ